MEKIYEWSKICTENKQHQCELMDRSTHSKKKKREVRQGRVLSPDLFSLYNEIIMRNLGGYPGIKVGGQYADDTVLIAGKKKTCNNY